MNKKTFTVSKLTLEEVNKLSIALNQIEQVSHLKIEKNKIIFKCIDIEPLEKIIKDINNSLIIEEVINGKAREYNFQKNIIKTHYYMLRHLDNDNDVSLLMKQCHYNINYDSSNKMITLTTNEKDVLKQLQTIMQTINPKVEIWEYKKPIRSSEVFKEKYLKNYLKIALIIVLLSLGIVSMKDLNIIYYICWTASILLIGETITKSAIKNITHFHLLHEDILSLIALILGVISHHPIESLITLILYMLSEPYRIKILEKSFKKMNNIIDIPEKCLVYENNQTKETLLSALKIDDILIIEKDMTIPVNGIVIKGESFIDTYFLTSSYELKSVKENDEVHSGEVNKGENIYIKVTSLYKSGHLSKMIDIASLAPIYQSKAELFIYKFSYYYTPVVIIIALIMIFMIFFMNKNISEYLYLSALLFMISGSFVFEQSASLGMLTGFAKAYKEGIMIESSYSLDAINGSQMIIYDTIDNQDINEEELELLNKLNHIGKTLIVFNDSQKELSGDFKVYNQLTNYQKQEIIDQSIVDVVYIGDSQKDIQCFQKSMVAISRGGISDSRVVENSDIILLDHSLDKVFKVFKIARNIREKSLFNMIFSFVIKLIFIILILAKLPIHLWMIIICEAILTFISLYIAVK